MYPCVSSRPRLSAFFGEIIRQKGRKKMAERRISGGISQGFHRDFTGISQGFHRDFIGNKRKKGGILGIITDYKGLSRRISLPYSVK